MKNIWISKRKKVIDLRIFYSTCTTLKQIVEKIYVQLNAISVDTACDFERIICGDNVFSLFSSHSSHPNDKYTKLGIFHIYRDETMPNKQMLIKTTRKKDLFVLLKI